jgi:hypothetical protein
MAAAFCNWSFAAKLIIRNESFRRLHQFAERNFQQLEIPQLFEAAKNRRAMVFEQLGHPRWVGFGLFCAATSCDHLRLC